MIGTRQVIVPRDENHWLEERAKDLTSTEIGALFGLSPWHTAFELHFRKLNRSLVEDVDNSRSSWGNRLQDAIAAGIAEDEKLPPIRRMNEYIRIPERRLGSSFDFEIVSDGLLEIKNVDYFRFKDTWIVDGKNIEAPPHIELQAQHELLVSGKQFIIVGALVGGNQVVHVRREPDLSIHAAIIREADKFWEGVDRGKAPAPDFTRDSDFIAKLYRSTQKGKLHDATNDSKFLSLVEEHARLGEIERGAKERRGAIKAELLTQIKDADKVIGNGFSISCGTTSETIVEKHTRAGFRNFRIFMKGK